MVRCIQKIVGLYIFFAVSLLCAEEVKPKIVYFTVPKGGSQLFKKVMSLITQKPMRRLMPLYESPWPDFLSPLDPCIAYHHLEFGYDSILEDEESSFLKVIMIRDPRDVIVSMAAWIQVMADTEAARQFVRLPLEEQIALLISAPDLSMNGRYPYVFDTKMILQCALKWMKNPSVLVCRFEDLVGTKGGGSRERQILALTTLSEHLHYDLSSVQIAEIADSLFGDTITFRKGQIGSWREVFTPFHKELFKAKMGQELIDLGYEQDYAW